jgi:hypothetical protein
MPIGRMAGTLTIIVGSIAGRNGHVNTAARTVEWFVNVQQDNRETDQPHDLMDDPTAGRMDGWMLLNNRSHRSNNRLNNRRRNSQLNNRRNQTKTRKTEAVFAGHVTRFSTGIVYTMPVFLYNKNNEENYLHNSRWKKMPSFSASLLERFSPIFLLKNRDNTHFSWHF